MKLNDTLRLSGRNICCKKKHSLRVFFNLLLVSSILMSWSVLSKSLKNANDYYLYRNAAKNFFEICMSDADTAEDRKRYEEEYEFLQSMDACGSPIEFWQMNIPAYLGKTDWLFVNMKYASCRIDGAEYQGNNDYSFYFAKKYDPKEPKALYTIPFRINICKTPEFYSENELVEYCYKYPDGPKDAMICGESTVGPNEIIVSDYMLEHFGIEGPYENLLGKPISFYADDKCIVDEAILTGVADSRLFYSSRFSETQIFLGYREDFKEKYALTELNTETPITDFRKTLEVFDKLYDAGYDVNTMILYMAYSSFDMVASAKYVVDKLVSFYALFIVCGVILNLINVLWRDSEERGRYSGMQRAMGMKKKGISGVICGELLILSALAIAGAVPISLGTLNIVGSVLETSVGFRLALDGGQMISIGALTTAILFGLLILIEIPLQIHMLKQQPHDLLVKAPFQ